MKPQIPSWKISFEDIAAEMSEEIRKIRQSLMKVSSDISHLGSSVKDQKTKSEIHKAEKLIDDARYILFKLQ